MGATDVALRIAAQHARKLRNAVSAGEDSDIRGGDAAAGAFRDENMVVGASRDLREMSNREYLVMRRDAPHHLADHEADATADAGVHLVEDECRHMVETREDRLEGEHHP